MLTRKRLSSVGLGLHCLLLFVLTLVFSGVSCVLVFAMGVSGGYSAHVKLPIADRADLWVAHQDRVSRGEHEVLSLQREALRTYTPDTFLAASLVVWLVFLLVMAILFAELWWVGSRSLPRQEKHAPGDRGGDEPGRG
jgi:hypothetical protein